MTTPTCEAYQRGQSMYCDRCGVNWDVDDNDPPQCKPVEPMTTPNGELSKMREELKNGQ